MKFNFILSIIFVFISVLGAQSDRVSGKIRGKVVDGINKDPLVGANVLLLPVEAG